MTTKLAAKLPKDRDINGLNAGEAAFLARPMDQVVVVAYVSTQKIVTDYKEGGREPVVSIDAVEIITDPFALAAVKTHFEMAHANRVHTAPTLPTEPEVEVEVEYPDCEGCGHDRDQHGPDGVCNGLDANEDACECNEYLVLCSCGHPWGLHDVDEGQCCYHYGDAAEADGEPECSCVEFEPIRDAIIGEVDSDDPDATEIGHTFTFTSADTGRLNAIADGLRLVQGGVSA